MSQPNQQGGPALRALLLRYLRPNRARIGVLAILILVDIGGQLLLPRVLTLFVDNVIARETLAVLAQLALAYLLIAVLRQIATSIGAYVATDIGMRATNALRSDMLRHTLSLDIAWHNSTTPGALIERIDGDTSNLNELLSALLPQLAANMLLIAGALMSFYVIDWRAGILVTLVLPLVFISVRWLGRHIELAAVVERETSSQLFGLIEERLSGTEDVRANGAVGYVMRRFYEASRIWSKAYIRSHTLGSLTFAVPSAINAALGLAVIALGLWLYGIGEVTLGAVLALYRYIDVLARPWFRLGRQITEILQAGASATRLSDLAAQQPTVRDTGTLALPAGPLALTVHDVTFHYDDSPEVVLDTVNFSLAPGRVLGVLGRTGSGKTTLARLITRLYDYNQGAITLNEKPLPELTLRTMRERVTMITQDVQVFSGTVRENITLYNNTIDDARVWLALERVGLRSWAEALPKQLDTQLTSSNSGLSAGQAQLLAFARAFMRESGLVIMDEASSRLDPATEQQLERAVDQLLHERTAIIIAHRLHTLDRADDILVLEDGRVAEFGSREALAHDERSRYYALLNFGAVEMLA